MRMKSHETIDVRNRYVPKLYAILDECNKLLDPDHRFTEKQFFIESNEYLDRLVARYTADRDLRKEDRERIIAELQKQKVKVEATEH